MFDISYTLRGTRLSLTAMVNDNSCMFHAYHGPRRVQLNAKDTNEIRSFLFAKHNKSKG